MFGVTYILIPPFCQIHVTTHAVVEEGGCYKRLGLVLYIIMHACQLLLLLLLNTIPNSLQLLSEM